MFGNLEIIQKRVGWLQNHPANVKGVVIMDLYMKDLYPNYGTVETSTVVQGDEDDQITAEDDQTVAEKTSNGTKDGTTKKTLFLSFILLLGLSFVVGVAK